MSGALVRDTMLDDDLVVRGQQLYDQQLKAILEPDHAGKFIAIEPDSGSYFVADTGIAALRAARAKVPGKFFISSESDIVLRTTSAVMAHERGSANSARAA